jgi:O-antigen/teichoic acid export membrane protein
MTTGVSSGVARLASLGVTLVSIPLAIHTLGSQDYGVYAAIAAVVSLLSFLDLGVGSALIREVSKASVDERESYLGGLISSAFFPLVALVVLAAALLVLVLSFVDLTHLLNTPPDLSRQEVSLLAALAFLPYLASMPLSLVLRVRYGLQEGHISNLWQVAGFLVQLVLVVVASARGAGLAVFVVILGAGPLLGYLLDSVSMFRRRTWAFPRVARVEAATARRLLLSGSLFVVLSISAAIGYETDAIVISHFLGSSPVTLYSVMFQLTVICPIGLSLFLNAMWPAYSEAQARGDVRWIRRAFARSLSITLPTAVLAAIALVLLAPWVIHRWIGPHTTPPASLLWASAAYVLINAVSGPLAMILNGLGHIRPQAAAGVVMAVVNLALSIALVQSVGVAGPVIGTDVAQVVCVLVPLGLYTGRVFRRELRVEVAS